MDRQTIIKRLTGFKRAISLDDRSFQVIIKFENGRVFQSNNIIVCAICDGVTYMTTDWDSKNVSSKHRNVFLAETGRETHNKLKSGIYKIIS